MKRKQSSWKLKIFDIWMFGEIESKEENFFKSQNRKQRTKMIENMSENLKDIADPYKGTIFI